MDPLNENGGQRLDNIGDTIDPPKIIAPESVQADPPLPNKEPLNPVKEPQSTVPAPEKQDTSSSSKNISEKSLYAKLSNAAYTYYDHPDSEMQVEGYKLVPSLTDRNALLFIKSI